MNPLTMRPAGWASPLTSRMSWTCRRQWRQTVSALMPQALPARRLVSASPAVAPPRDPRGDRLERLIGLAAVGASGLR